MSIKKIIVFTDFMWFYNKYKPLSPYGCDNKDKFRFIADSGELNNIHQFTANMIEFIQSNGLQAQKIEHHLSRIVRLNSLNKESFDATDLLLIKQFLIHCKAISSHLNSDTQSLFKFKFSSPDLLNRLAGGKDFTETFYLSSDFDEKLAETRKKIIQIDHHLNSIKETCLDRLKKDFQLDFNNREFVLIDKTLVDKLDKTRVLCEFYDTNMVLAKPIFPDNYMDGLIGKEELLKKETEQEKLVLHQLSEAVLNEKHNLLQYIKVITKLDTFMARARLAIHLNLSKPNIGDGISMKIEDGVFLPLKEKHNKLGMSYTPLTAKFKSNAILLSGSNMGGKTVLFKTVGFLQLITQMGFWVPAKSFHTRLFHRIHVLGVNDNEKVEGLSSFGQEVYDLSKVFNQTSQVNLLLADEIAKTTNAAEAKAMLYALLNHVSSHKNLTGYFTTHFINMPQIKGVYKFRMKGLNHELLEKHYHQNGASNIQDKIKLISSFMQYEIEEDEHTPHHFDALIIAKMLGLNKEVIKQANEYLDKSYDTVKIKS